MTTPLDIINFAFRNGGIFGVGQTASAADAEDALTMLNSMLDEWQTKRWFVYHLLDLSVASTGAVSYSIGPGGNIDTGAGSERPDRIEAGFFRQVIPSQPNQVDYPLRQLMAREDYNLISLKQLVTFPEAFFYDSAWPLGFLYVWPLPQSGMYTLHFSVKAQLSHFTSLTQSINLPAIYLPCLRWNLAADLKPNYGLPEDPQVTRRAQRTLTALANSNAQVPQLQVPAVLVRPGLWNIYSDRFY